MIIAIDFDGTLAEHEFPAIGRENEHAIDTCLALQREGHKLILLTMRSDRPEGKFLTDAVEWCRERGLEFWAVNENPEQESWTGSRKVYANLYIDDAALGCPLFYPIGSMNTRAAVDWVEVIDYLRVRNALPNEN